MTDQELNCDFCGEPTTKESMTIIPTKSFTIPEIGYANLSWGWSLCTDCTPLWATDLQPLLDRAVAHHPRGEEVRSILTWIYAGLQANQNGPLRGWHPMDEG